MNELREKTYWMKLVWLDFNTSWMVAVDDVKQQCANIIDLLISITVKENEPRPEMTQQAINEIITAQMWAVKALTYKY